MRIFSSRKNKFVSKRIENKRKLQFAFEKKDYRGYFFIFPSFIGVMAFYIIPFFDVIQNSFFSPFNYKWSWPSSYYKVLDNQAFRLALYNTGRFLVICVPLLIIISLCLAFYINYYIVKRNYIKAVFLLPLITPVSALVLLSKLILSKNGFLNQFLRIVNIKNIDWFNSDYAFLTLIFIYIWKNLGFIVLLWCVSLETVPKEVYESAALDGANGIQKLTRITIPNMMTSLFVVTIISILNFFKIFRESYLIFGDYPHKSVYMLQNVFNNWFRDLAIDKMSAGAVILSSIIFLLVLILFKLWISGENRDELF